MAHRTVLARLALLLFPLAGLGSTDLVAAADEPAALTTIDLSIEVAASVEWTVGLFEAAGLDLPPLVVVEHEGAEACLGRPGIHRYDGQVSRIDLCDPQPGANLDYLVLHETAHAWAAHGLSIEAEAAFQELRGYPVWRDFENYAWHENGTEQAAEIMVWGLIDRPFAPARIADNGCDQLLAGYRTLTGLEPLHGSTELCR